MPDLDRASTSHVERKNGSLRQWCKRLTRLTYGSACGAGVALRVLQFLPDSSLVARDAGDGRQVADHVWTLRELLAP
jgi:hypothetical protein